jgi:hypothetical protein
MDNFDVRFWYGLMSYLEQAQRSLADDLHKPWKLHDLGLQVDRNEYHYNFEQLLQLLHLPSYAFDNEDYWIEYQKNWCLNKGEGRLIEKPLSDIAGTGLQLLSASLHQVISVDKDSQGLKVAFESSLSESTFKKR